MEYNNSGIHILLTPNPILGILEVCQIHLPNGGHLLGLLEYGLVVVLAQQLKQKMIGIADGIKCSPYLSPISCQAARPWILDVGQLRR